MQQHPAGAPNAQSFPPSLPPPRSRAKLEAAAQQQRPIIRIWIDEVGLAPGDIVTSLDAVQRAARYMTQELKKVGSAAQPVLVDLGKALLALQEYVTQAAPAAGSAQRALLRQVEVDGYTPGGATSSFLGFGSWATADEDWR